MNKYGWFESCNIQEYFHRNQGIICLQGIWVLILFIEYSCCSSIFCFTYYTDSLWPYTSFDLYEWKMDSKWIDEPISDDEFNRAKNQLKSMVFMNLEHPSVFCEEIGQQLLSYDKQKTPEQTAQEIDAITKEDIMRSVKDLLNYPIAYSVFGKGVQKEVKMLPPVEGISSYLKMAYK